MLKSKELQEVLQVIARHSHALRNRVMLLMSHWCGLRVSDLAALDLGHVCNADGSIKTDLRLQTQHLKSQRSRNLFLPDRLRRELAAYLADCKHRPPGSPLFFTQKRTRFTANSLSQHFLTLYRRCGLDGASAQSGRRSFINHLASQGASPRLLMAAAGYSRTQIAQPHLKSAAQQNDTDCVAEHIHADLDNEAANDALLNPSPHRNAALPGSLTQVSGYPDKLKIYLTSASSFWQVRCFFQGKVHVKSLKTADKRRAQNLAKTFYDELMARAYLRQSVSRLPQFVVAAQEETLFAALAERMLHAEQQRVVRSELASQSLAVMQSRVRKHLVPYFGLRDIGSINHDGIERFIAHLSTREVGSITLSQYLQSLRKIFNYALANDLIRKIPPFPKIKLSSTPRGGFSTAEYWQLLRAARTLAHTPVAAKIATHRNTAGGIYTNTDDIPREMVWLIGFMVNSFVRPVDVKLIQHKHIEIVRGEHVYLRLTLPETKLHKRQIVTLCPAVRIYESLCKYMKPRGYTHPDDYLFLPQIKNRKAASLMIANHFTKVLDATGLRIGNLGQRRTVYSLRHTAIMFRLLYGKGIDLLTLARNARTSVDMIEQFYASNLTAEMNIGLLQSRRLKSDRN